MAKWNDTRFEGSVNISPYTWKVKRTDSTLQSNPGCVGCILLLDSEISLKDGLSMGADWSVLFHEIMHGLVHVIEEGELGENEKLLTTMGNAIFNMLMDSEGFLEALLREKKRREREREGY